jgi:hypothetical protein
VKRNPSFEGEGTVTLSKRGLRKLFDTTWDTAYFDGEPDHIGDSQQYDRGRRGLAIELDALKSIFGFR